MSKWPADTTSAKNAFYGNFKSKGWEDKNLVHMFAPFTMYYDKKPMAKGILVHKLIVPALTAVFNDVWDQCGHDAAKVAKTGLSDWGGCYNVRRISGSNNWSNHSWACAVDISPSTNGFNMKTTLSAMVIAAFKKQGFLWGGDYSGRKNPMHFEAVSR